jgi:hypothetical protein
VAETEARYSPGSILQGPGPHGGAGRYAPITTMATDAITYWLNVNAMSGADNTNPRLRVSRSNLGGAIERSFEPPGLGDGALPCRNHAHDREG